MRGRPRKVEAAAARDRSGRSPSSPDRAEPASRRRRQHRILVRRAAQPRIGTGPRSWTSSARGRLATTTRSRASTTPRRRSSRISRILIGEGEYHCRGLVLGYVQSGKTTNFTAVIAKAADAGYRFFIVLSRHPQRAAPADPGSPQRSALGAAWNSGTGSPTRTTFGRPITSTRCWRTQNQRVLAIVKKNGPRLRALKKWLLGARPELLAACPDPDHRRRGGPGERQHGQARPPADDDQQAHPRDRQRTSPSRPTSATPRHRSRTCSSTRRTTRISTRGISSSTSRGPRSTSDPRRSSVASRWSSTRTRIERRRTRLRPQRSRSTSSTICDRRARQAGTNSSPRITDSLDAALRYFLLSTAARRVRRQGNRHATALVHTSQHVDVHERTAEAIRGHLRSLADRDSHAGSSAPRRAGGAVGRRVRSACRAPTSASSPSPGRTSRRAARPSPTSAEVITDNSRTEG